MHWTPTLHALEKLPALIFSIRLFWVTCDLLKLFSQTRKIKRIIETHPCNSHHNAVSLWWMPSKSRPLDIQYPGDIVLWCWYLLHLQPCAVSKSNDMMSDRTYSAYPRDRHCIAAMKAMHDISLKAPKRACSHISWESHCFCFCCSFVRPWGSVVGQLKFPVVIFVAQYLLFDDVFYNAN